jgi:hypothetical protein
MAAWVGSALVESLPTAWRKAAANCSQLTKRSAAVLANAVASTPSRRARLGRFSLMRGVAR